MKSSLFIAATGAAMAMAGPIEKRILQTSWVYDIVTVTVTAGIDMPAPTQASIEQQPTAQPTITQAPVVAVPATTQAPPPAPTSQVVSVVVSVPVVPVTKPSPKPEAPVQSQAPSVGTDYASVVVNEHNLHRQNHSASALTWDNTLAEYAETIAKKCVFAHDMHQGSGGYGQNLASIGASGDLSGKENDAGKSAVTDQWYNGEMPHYNDYYGDANPPSSAMESVGHFTQVVWKGTNKVGCYTAECPSGTIFGMPSLFTVCNYSPPGNFGGEFGNQVGKPDNMAIRLVSGV